MTIIGTSPDAIDQAEDRERFQTISYGISIYINRANGRCVVKQEAIELAKRIGYPWLLGLLMS